jgi:nitrogen fixation-related uncharacterized protein
MFSSVGHYLFTSLRHSIVCCPLLVIILSVLLCWSFYCLVVLCWSLYWKPTEENRQYNDQQRRRDNIMTNRGQQTIEWPTGVNRQYNDQQSWSFYCLFFSVVHSIVCSPLLVILFSVLLCWSFYCMFSSVDLYIVWTDNKMTNRGEQTIEWPTEENRQYNDQQRTTDNRMTKTGEQITSVVHTIIYSPLLVIIFLYSPLLVIILSVPLCWSLYCLFSSVGHYFFCSPLLIIIFYVLL